MKLDSISRRSLWFQEHQSCLKCVLLGVKSVQLDSKIAQVDEKMPFNTPALMRRKKSYCRLLIVWVHSWGQWISCFWLSNSSAHYFALRLLCMLWATQWMLSSSSWLCFTPTKGARPSPLSALFIVSSTSTLTLQVSLSRPTVKKSREWSNLVFYSFLVSVQREFTFGLAPRWTACLLPYD